MLNNQSGDTGLGIYDVMGADADSKLAAAKTLLAQENYGDYFAVVGVNVPRNGGD